MFESRQTLAQTGLILRIDVRHHHTRAPRQAVQHHAPRIDDHTVTVGFAAGEMIASLRGGDDIRQILNCAGPHQRFEMRLAGGFGKSRRHHDQIHIRHGPIDFGETQVIANRQSDATERAVDHDDRIPPLDGLLFLIVFNAKIEAKQMNLVVTRHLLAALVVDQAGVAHLVRIGALQRHRTAHQPELVLLGHAGKKVLHRTLAFLFPHLHLVGVLQSHDGEILRQCHQPRAGFGHLLDQTLRLEKIGHHIGAGCHLNGRYPNGPGGLLGRRFLLAAAGAGYARLGILWWF